jgi:RNA polymerase sigma-70 factor, ECF subfamily
VDPPIRSTGRFLMTAGIRGKHWGGSPRLLPPATGRWPRYRWFRGVQFSATAELKRQNQAAHLIILIDGDRRVARYPAFGGGLFHLFWVFIMGEPGRTDEFVRLFTKDGRWIFSYILMLIPHKADAEEVFQETSVTLWQKFGEFLTGSNFRAWAIQVAHYKILQYRARKQGGPLLLDDAVLEAVHNTAVILNDRLDDLHRALEKCRGKLNDGDRELLDRRYESGATAQSIAEVLGRSPRAIYRALDRIHRALYDCIHQEMSEDDRP